MPTRTVNPHIPSDLWAWVGHRAVDTGKQKSAIVAEAAEAWLADPGPVDGEAMTRRHLRLDADLHDRLSAAADAAGCSVAEVVRAAIAAAMEAHHSGGESS
jgi:predicted DNA-binding protein